jgi:hypothetical protein
LVIILARWSAIPFHELAACVIASKISPMGSIWPSLSNTYRCDVSENWEKCEGAKCKIVQCQLAGCRYSEGFLLLFEP